MAIIPAQVQEVFNSVKDVVFSTASKDAQPNACIVTSTSTRSTHLTPAPRQATSSPKPAAGYGNIAKQTLTGLEP